jgi:hypothetical protein
MADETIFELTPETAMTAAARFIVQETAATTRATSATFALMGGLEQDTSKNSAADHADIPADAGKLYLINLSALGSDMDITLPVAASVQTGERVGVFITAGNSGSGSPITNYELNLYSGASGDLINGVDHSQAVSPLTPWSKLFITGECVIFRCIDGSTADWIVEYDGRIPCKVRMTASTDITTNSASTEKVIVFDGTPTFDVGNVSDTANGWIVIRRQSYWAASCQCLPENTVGTDNWYATKVRLSGLSTVTQWQIIVNAYTSDAIRYTSGVGINELRVADTIKGYFQSQIANDGCSASDSFLLAWEILS